MTPAPGHSRRDWIDRLILVVLALSLIAGFLLRTYRMDWDRGHQYLFHPDERALVYSAIANISLPFPLDTQRLLRPDSPLNPHFFNYGNLPMYLTRAGAHILSLVVKNAWTNENIWMTGRGLSALFDMLTIVIAFFMGSKLYGRRVGLLAAVFGSFTVLHIQLSHFLTVDTYLTTFIALGMYFAIDIVRKGSLKAGLLMGIALGLAMATKVSVAPLLASVVVAWGLWAWRGASDTAAPTREHPGFGDRLAKAILGVIIAVVAAGVFFVVTSPYAIIDWTSFMRSVDEQSRMVRGIADYPYTRQYLYTPVFLYQIWNSAIWGMGVPLGIAAYGGLVFVTARVLMRRRSDEIVLLSWVLVYFFINGIFQVKFMRYMLPLYPFLAIMAAELLWQMWDWAGKRHDLSLRNFLRVPVAYAAERVEHNDVLLDAESEAWEREKAQAASVLSRPARRAAAPPPRRGRQVTAAPGVPPEVAAAPPASVTPAAKPLAPARDVPPPTVDITPAPPPAAPAGTLRTAEPLPPETSVAAPPAVSAQPPSLAMLRATLATWTRGQAVVAALMAFVVFSTVFYALAFMNVYRQVHPWISISEWIYRNIPVGATISNEHWDDALPLGRRVDGQQRTFEQYKHVEATNYEDDGEVKLDMLVKVVTKADYIVLATNRLYGTIARLPERYPVTSRYYELLFAEQLGFKLVAYSAVYPSFAGVTFMNDTLVDPRLPRPALLAANRPAGLVINLGKADESFTVYDHPMPLVFQKTEQFSEEQVRALFAGTVVKAQQYQFQRQQSRAGRAAQPSSKTFLLSDAERTAQEAGGTYTELFNPDSLANRLPVLVWWIAVELIALLALPVGFVVFGNLRDRGYAVSKTLGLLLVAYLPWLLGSFKLLAFGRISIVLSMLLVGLLSLAIWRQRGAEIATWLRQNRWLVLTNEVVFGVAFLAFVGIRILNPDLWQPWNGGEKPMEFAFLSAIARSTYFPPYDPFFAGGYINYYYYGMYICALVIRLTGIMPSVAFNLIIPMLFALTCANAFSIVYNLVAGMLKRPEPADGSLPAYLRAHGSLLNWALAGALFVTVIGNLATLGEVFKGPWNRGQTTVSSSIPGVTAALRVVDGVRKGMQPGQRMFDTFNYWNPSRVVPETINEFPFWSYLFADLHPHTIGIPFTLLVLALALNLLKERRQRPATPAADDSEPGVAPAYGVVARTGGVLAWIQERLAGIRPEDVLGTLVLALAVGSLGAINTWDLPTYLGVLLCAIVLRAWVETGRLAPTEIVLRFGVIAALSLALYLPFYQKYAALASGIGLVRSRTPVGYYLAIYGFFLFVLISFMVVDVMSNRRGLFARLGRLFGRYYDDAPLVVQRLRRLTAPADSVKSAFSATLLLALLCLALLALKQGILVLLLPLLLIALVRGLAARHEPERVFTWVLVFTGFLVSLGIEIVFLRDWLQGGSAYRMNTLFKFGIQIWVFLALSSAVGLAMIAERLRARGVRAASGAAIWSVVLVGMLFIVFLFPVLGIPARVNDRFPGDRPATGTLDGTAFMSVGRYNFDWERRNFAVELTYDYQAIQWLLRNVEGSPVIAEAVLPYYRELGARVSAFTGLPTLVGNQHEQEQRPGDTQVGPRENDARAIYNETSFERVLPLLVKHRVRYIYVGQLEQALYAGGLAKFDQAVGTYLDLVYENPKVKIYYVRPQ